MILQELNEPFLNMAVSKAATLLGAYDVNIVDNLAWDQDYMGRLPNNIMILMLRKSPIYKHKIVI